MRPSAAAMRATNASLAAAGDDALGVHAAERVGDHELRAQQADPVDRQRRRRLRLFGDRQVDVDAGRQRLDERRGIRRRHRRDRGLGRSFRRMSAAGVDLAAAAVDGDERLRR